MPPSRTIIVKLRRRAKTQTCLRKLDSLVGTEICEARPVFPDDADPELSTLFELELRSTASLDDVLARLQSDGDIEYAHRAAERKPQ
jgi:hypothetical protein